LGNYAELYRRRSFALRWLRQAGVLIALILVFIVGVIYSAKSVFAVPYAAEPHKSVMPTLVLITNLPHDVDFPTVSLKCPQFHVNSGRRRFHDNFVNNRGSARFSDVQNLARQQQIAERSVIGGGCWQSVFADVYPVSTFYNCRLCSPHIYNSKTPSDLGSMAEKYCRMPDMICGNNRDVANAQLRGTIRLTYHTT
jgi:hypothetical protein